MNMEQWKNDTDR